jgi:hypothetical protein
MNPDNAPILVAAISTGAFALLIGTLIGWMTRSLFIARELRRRDDETWRAAKTYFFHRYNLDDQP